MLNRGQIAELEAELKRYLRDCNGGKGAELPTAGEHLPDEVDQAVVEHDVLIITATNANRTQLCDQVRAALARIASKEYTDQCAVCGKDVPFERLLATPWAIAHVQRDGRCVSGEEAVPS